MDTVLKSLYIKLDSNANTLTKSAIGQIIVKILFANKLMMSKEDIIRKYAEVTNQKRINEQIISDVLERLVRSDIKYSKGHYYLSTSKREKIRKSVELSSERKKNIIEKYFSKLFSDTEYVEEWLQDITIKFFEIFANEWISDLLTHHNSIAKNESTIKDIVEKRTINNKQLDKRDYDELPTRFFSFIMKNEPEVNDYMWEYGTSAFAAQLISNKQGVDSITLEAFKDSMCIVDTNVLLFIALESKYHDGLAALERAFSDLGIEVVYLYITKREYEEKVLNEKNYTIHNFEKFGEEISKIPDDDFTNSAKRRRCITKNDFETFYKQILEIPEKIIDQVEIKLLDSSTELNAEIEKHQKDENLISLLNEKYYSLTGHNKKSNALKHDIGLVYGTEFLRRENKCFILSDDFGVNKYSQGRPMANNLPLSIRIDTLINVLAVNNGGDTFEASNYIKLFANIIRYGLVPHKDTFKQEELYDLYNMDEEIARLGNEEKKVIIKEMHELKMQGADEEKMLRELKSKITRGKIKAVSDLDDTKKQLYMSERSKKMAEERTEKVEQILKQKLEEEYDAKTKWLKIKYKYVIPICNILLICVVVFLFWRFINDGENSLNSLFISEGVFSFISIIINIVNYFFNVKDKLSQRDKDRDKYIRKETKNRMND